MTESLKDRASNTISELQSTCIADEWARARSGQTIDVFDPGTGAVLGTVPNCGVEDVDRVVRAARDAFDTGPWRDLTPAGRARILWRVGDLIEEHAEELAMIESLDNGKPYAAALAVDVPFSAECFRYMAGIVTKIEGSVIPVSLAGEWHVYTRREPLGVIGQIVPWNFPLLMAAMKLAPALACGNSVVLKPSEWTPYSVLRLRQLMDEAGIPPGVVNIVTGEGERAGSALTSHESVNALAFTGSTRVGKLIAAAALPTLKRVSLELGGKSANIIFADADLDQAIAGAAAAIFYNSGQNCQAGSRLYVHRDVYDEVLAGVTEIAARLRVGSGQALDTELGPMVSQQHRTRVSDYVESGRSEGANVVIGGSALDGDGYFYQPTVLTGVKPGMRVVDEEIFGPVLVAMDFDTLEDAIGAANASDYGLAAGVWTQDVTNVHRAAALLRAGNIFVNCWGVADPAVPFGGYKQSGWGRENGTEAVRLYTEEKSVYTKLG